MVLAVISATLIAVSGAYSRGTSVNSHLPSLPGRHRQRPLDGSQPKFVPGQRQTTTAAKRKLIQPNQGLGVAKV